MCGVEYDELKTVLRASSDRLDRLLFVVFARDAKELKGRRRRTRTNANARVRVFGRDGGTTTNRGFRDRPRTAPFRDAHVRRTSSSDKKRQERHVARRRRAPRGDDETDDARGVEGAARRRAVKCSKSEPAQFTITATRAEMASAEKEVEGRGGAKAAPRARRPPSTRVCPTCSRPTRTPPRGCAGAWAETPPTRSRMTRRTRGTCCPATATRVSRRSAFPAEWS